MKRETNVQNRLVHAGKAAETNPGLTEWCHAGVRPIDHKRQSMWTGGAQVMEFFQTSKP